MTDRGAQCLTETTSTLDDDTHKVSLFRDQHIEYTDDNLVTYDS